MRLNLTWRAKQDIRSWWRTALTGALVTGLAAAAVAIPLSQKNISAPPGYEPQINSVPAKIYRSPAGACVKFTGGGDPSICEACEPDKAGDLRICELRFLEQRKPVGSPVYSGTVTTIGGGNDAEPIYDIRFQASPGQLTVPRGEFASEQPGSIYRSPTGPCLKLPEDKNPGACLPCTTVSYGDLKECRMSGVKGPNRRSAGIAVYRGTVTTLGGGREPVSDIRFRAAAGQPETPPVETAQEMPARGRTSEQPWDISFKARTLAEQRKGSWEIPLAAIVSPPSIKTPVEQILACWAQGARDPTAMWHCSGRFVSHGDFAACVTGAWCIPPTVVPYEIRATGMPLAAYSVAAREPIHHIAVTRANATACLSPGITEANFGNCFLPKQMPMPDLLAMRCASTLRSMGRVPDAEWIRMCAASAANISLSLPPSIQQCVNVKDSTSNLLTACLRGLNLQSKYCRQLDSGEQGLWLACLYEQAAEHAKPRGELDCLVKQAQEGRGDPIKCLRDESRVPMEAAVDMGLCTVNPAGPVEVCLSRAMMGVAAPADCKAASPDDVLICVVAAKDEHAGAVARCLRGPAGDRATCIAGLVNADPKITQILSSCTKNAADLDPSCLAEKYFADVSPAARCLGAEQLQECLVGATLGSNGLAVLDCARKADADAIQACLDAAGIELSPELDAAWACWNSKGSEDAMQCLAGKALGEGEREILECARKAATKEAAALCMASTQLGERERALLECVQESGETEETLVCAVGASVLNAKDRRTLACAMRGGIIDFVLCQNSGGLTPEQQTAVACAAQTGGEPITYASCVGAKLTLMELTKCVFLGVGTQQGCFSESNDLRRAVETAYNDLTHGPGANNDLVQLAGKLQESLSAMGDRIGGPAGDVLKQPNFLPVLVGPTLIPAIDAGGKALNEAGTFLGNLCNCEISL